MSQLAYEGVEFCNCPPRILQATWSGMYSIRIGFETLVGCAWLCRESVKESFRRCADCSDKGYCITIEMSFLRYQESVRDRDMW